MPMKTITPLPAASGFTKAMQIQQNKYSDYSTLIDKQYQTDYRALQGAIITDREFETKKASLNAQYENMWAQYQAQHDQGINEIKRLQGMAGKGEIDPDLGERAAYKMVLPPEEFAARYPNQRQPSQARPISAPGLKSAATMMSGLIGEAEDKRGIEWGDPYKTKAGLVEKYIEWRSQAGYDYMDPLHQRQLDMRWDSLMKTDKKYRDWFSDKKKATVNPEARTLRMKTRMGRVVQKKMGVIKSASPIGKSIIGAARKEAAPVNNPTAEDLRQQGGAKAYNRGVELGYWK